MRGHFSTYQGEGPQACWRQVKGLQRRYGGKGSAGLYRFRLRLVLITVPKNIAGIRTINRLSYSSGINGFDTLEKTLDASGKGTV